MNDEKWEQLVEMVKGSFKNVELATEPIVVQTQDGPVHQGVEDILEFDAPKGRFRLVREQKPVVLEKKEHFSHRMGDTARVEYKHSDTEFTHKLRVYKEVDIDEWDEVTLDSLGL